MSDHSPRPLSRTKKAELIDHVIDGARRFLSRDPQSKGFWTPPGETRSPFERWLDDARDAFALIDAADWNRVLGGVVQRPLSLTLTIENLRALKQRIKGSKSTALTAAAHTLLEARTALLVWGDHIIDLTNGHGDTVVDFERPDYELFLDSDLGSLLETARSALDDDDSVDLIVSQIDGHIDVDSLTPSANAEVWHAGWALLSLAWLLADKSGDALTIAGSWCCTFDEAVQARLEFVERGDVECPRCGGELEVERDVLPSVSLVSIMWTCRACDVCGYFPFHIPPRSVWKQPRARAGDLRNEGVPMTNRDVERRGKIFIGHGRSSVWRDLKDFLHERLGLPWDEFNREPTAGYATKERLVAMLNDASFAFIVMTAEDEHGDGKKHARENVVHEAGLFQGRLGFERAIILLEDGCEQFSNIEGITQIRFPKGDIKAKFEEIRRVLEREAIASK